MLTQRLKELHAKYVATFVEYHNEWAGFIVKPGLDRGKRVQRKLYALKLASAALVKEMKEFRKIKAAELLADNKYATKRKKKVDDMDVPRGDSN